MNNRSHSRHTINIKALLHSHDSKTSPTECSLVDLSAGGARVVSNKKLDRDSIISLQIGTFGIFSIEVIWMNNAGIGLKFNETAEVMAEVVMAVAVYG